MVGEGAFDGLLDPPSGVGGEFAALCGIETLDGFHEADIAFGDEVEERQAEVGVIVSDFDDEAEIGADHQGSGGFIALLDFGCEVDFLFNGEKGDEPDFAEINFDP